MLHTGLFWPKTLFWTRHRDIEPHLFSPCKSPSFCSGDEHRKDTISYAANSAWICRQINDDFLKNMTGKETTDLSGDGVPELLKSLELLKLQILSQNLFYCHTNFGILTQQHSLPPSLHILMLLIKISKRAGGKHWLQGIFSQVHDKISGQREIARGAQQSRVLI